MNFNVNQNILIGEHTNPNLIDFLYNISKDKLSTDQINFVGYLISNYAYTDAINYLTQNYNNLHLNILLGNLIRINDPEVLRIFINNNLSASGVGMTMDDFNNITSRNQINTIFKNNTNITDLRCLKNITKIPFNAGYDGCLDGLTNLEHLYVPDYLGSLHNGSVNGIFKNNTNLKTVEFNNITQTGYSTFAGCSNLELSELPNSLTKIVNSTFEGCSKITINDSNNLTSIGGYAFRNCTSITSFIIRNKVNDLGGSAFYNCSNLETVIFESGGENNLTFGTESSYSNSGIFKNTKVKKLVLPERLTYIGNASLYGVSTIVLNSSTPPGNGGQFGNMFTNDQKVYVPDELVDTYKTTYNTEKIYPLSSLTD